MGLRPWPPSGVVRRRPRHDQPGYARRDSFDGAAPLAASDRPGGRLSQEPAPGMLGLALLPRPIG
jgi:hypothetical protein